MKFLKNLFNDDGAIIGLCGFDEFKSTKPRYSQKSAIEESFFNHFSAERKFETNFTGNLLLSL